MNIELNINDRSYHKYYFYNDDDAYQYKDSLVLISFNYSTGVPDKTIIDVNHYTFDINGYAYNRLMVRNDVPYKKDDFEYSSDGLLLSHISYKYSESLWVPQVTIITTYNPSQLLVTQSTYQYIPASDYWRTDRVINNVYDDDLIISSETYKHLIWKEGFPSSYVVPEYSMIIDETMTYFRNMYGNLDTAILKFNPRFNHFSDPVNYSLIERILSYYNYEEVEVDIPEFEATSAYVSYPNHMTDILTIHNPLLESLKIKIIDINGQTRHFQKNDRRVEHVKVDVSGLDHGWYILEVIGDNGQPFRQKY